MRRWERRLVALAWVGIFVGFVSVGVWRVSIDREHARVMERYRIELAEQRARNMRECGDPDQCCWIVKTGEETKVGPCS